MDNSECYICINANWVFVNSGIGHCDNKKVNLGCYID